MKSDQGLVAGGERSLSIADEDIRRKFEAFTRFPHLLQRKFPFPRQEHGDSAFRPELRNEVALCEVLLFDEESHDRNRVRGRDRIVGLFGARWILKSCQLEERIGISFQLLLIKDYVGSTLRRIEISFRSLVQMLARNDVHP